jgi:hypothetical protein
MIMIANDLNLEFVTSLKEDVAMEIVDFQSNNSADSTFNSQMLFDVDPGRFGCFGTLGSIGGCAGTFATVGCASAGPSA